MQVMTTSGRHALRTPSDSLAETIRTYDAVAESYASRFADVDLFSDRRRFLQGIPAGPVLDAGCGSGRDCQFFLKDGVNAVGIDLSAGMLEVAARNTDAPIIEADIRAIPARDNVFAGVWCCAVLLHLDPPDAATALREFGRVLIKHGRLFISVRHGVGESVRDDGRDLTRRYVLYQPDQLAGSVARSGFEVDRVEVEPGVVGGSWINLHAHRR
jgi:SAM-dependent methyltransferase